MFPRSRFLLGSLAASDNVPAKLLYAAAPVWKAVVRKNNSAFEISWIRAIGSDVRSTLRIGRIADVT
jgi:hypothetical protein